LNYIIDVKMLMNVDWKLCLIADTEAVGDRNLASIVYQAVSAGVSLVQLRAKNLKASEFFHLAFEISHLLSPLDIPLIINDRADIALACEANGVHLGKEDLPLIEARRVLGENRIIGISANTLEAAMEAQAKGADYLGVGPIYSTDSKADAGPALGIDGLESIRRSIDIPILAIGGLNPTNAHESIAAGANGIAVISAILDVHDTSQAVHALLKAIRYSE
jgi:thiamine-phosphate pyrophosphorylase